MLAELQSGLERLYRIDTELSVTDFLVDERTRDSTGVGRRPQEQLLVAECEDALELGLFLDPKLVESLDQARPLQELDPFLMALEGVSHFVCVAWNAQSNRQISALELELQGEVDKYVTCVLEGAGDGIRRRLFDEPVYDPALTGEERERYVVANRYSGKYAAALDALYVRPGRLGEMLPELRRFYRMTLAAKLQHILRLA